MSFDWSQYLEVARELAEQAKSTPYPLQEAKYRASISRAYYAAFGKARHYLKHNDRIQEPYPPLNSMGERISIHQYVIETFSNSTDQARTEIGVNLDRMKQNRTIADYEIYHVMLNNLPFTVQATLKWAKETLTALSRLQ